MGDIKLKYDDCPYGCTNGKVLDAKLRKMVDCPYCSEKRKDLARKGLAESSDGEVKPLASILGIENQYLSTKLSYESLIPDGEMLFLEDESLKTQKDNLEEIYLGLSVGQLPERSYCIGLGNKGRIDRLAYPLLTKAYLSGLSVGKFMSCSEYNRLCIDLDNSIKSLYNCDFLMMLIGDGSSKADIASAKGLMQTRALKGKSTIFVTTWSVEACSILCGYYNDNTHFMARAVFVEYKVSKSNKGHSKYINQLTGVENGVYMEEEKETSERGKSFTTLNGLMGG